MKRYEKFGWPAKADLASRLKSLRESQRIQPEEWLIDSLKWEAPLEKQWVAIDYFLLDDIAHTQKYAREVVADSLEFFFGSWRSRVKTDDGTFDVNWWRTHSSWIDPFRASMCWASCLGDWQSVRRIAKFPPSDCAVSPGYTREDRDCYLALACHLRKDPPSRVGSLLQKIQAGSKQKPKLLAQILGAFIKGDTRRICDATLAYLKYFGRTEFRRMQLTRLYCLDGTFFVNLARREGVTVRPPEELASHVIFL